MQISVPHMLLGLWLAAPKSANAETFSFTLDELMSMSDDVMPLLDVIASGEGNYNSVNRGRAGDSPGDWTKNNLGKSLTEMSIKEIRQHQGGKNKDCWYNGKKGKANLFAVGRYQLIPCTLQYATIGIEDLDVRTIYEPEVQDAFGVFLLFVKRPVVGEYLLGEHNDFKEAGQELAKEFASVPIQYSNGKCKRGQSYYCGDRAGNKAHIALEDIERAMKQVRKNLKEDQKTQRMVENKRSVGQRIVHWWKRMWGTAELPPQTTPLVNTMDHTLFDFIYHTETSKPAAIPSGVIKLEQVPATNLDPPAAIEPIEQFPPSPDSKALDASSTDSIEIETKTIQPQPKVTEPTPVEPTDSTPEYNDDIDDIRIVPTDTQKESNQDN